MFPHVALVRRPHSRRLRPVARPWGFGLPVLEHLEPRLLLAAVTGVEIVPLSQGSAAHSPVGEPFLAGLIRARSISDGGRFIAFESKAGDLVTGDTNNATDIFLVDREANTIRRISVTPAGQQIPQASRSPHMSADGQFIVFGSLGKLTDDTPDNPNEWNTFLYDRIGTKLIRVPGSGNNNGITDPAISADGSTIAFSAGPFGDTRIYTYKHLQQPAPTAPTQIPQLFGGSSQFPSLSDDGRYVAFESTMELPGFADFNSPDVFWHDREMNETQQVSVTNSGEDAFDFSGNTKAAAISGDGQLVAFQSAAGNLAGQPTFSIDMYVRDVRAGGLTTLVSKTPGGAPGNGNSVGFAFFSGDGNRLVFESFASDLLPQDNDTLGDIYLWEHDEDKLQLISATTTGVKGNGESLDPFISHDGERITFFSRASNLVPGGHTGPDDLILVHLVDRATVGTVFALEPTIGLTSVELTQLKGATGDLPLFIEIVYTDEDGIRESTLSGTALTLTSGATQLQAVFDRLAPQTGNGNNDTSERVIYRVNPPTGGWTEQFALIYDVATSGTPLRDVNDQAMPPQTELAFDVHIMAAPSMTLVEPTQDIPFSALTAGGMSQPIFFKVRYQDANKVNESHLLNTELRIIRAFVPPNLAGVGIAVPAPRPGELNQVDDTVETITYRLDPPPVIGWVGFQPGDFFVQTSDDPAKTAKDLFDSRVAPDQLIGLFSILDDITPRLVLLSDESTKVVAPRAFPPVLAVKANFEIQETVGVDESTIRDGNIDIRKAGSGELLGPMMNLTGSQTRAEYQYVPSAGFNGLDGRYEFVTSVPGVRDNAGNAVTPGQVLGSFIIDFTGPTGELLPGSPASGASTFTFKVKWKDPVAGVAVHTVLGPMALRVRTPEGTLLDVQSTLPPPVDAPPAAEFEAEYTVTNPGGVWNPAAEGYKVEAARIVFDDAENEMAVGTVIGTFTFRSGVDVAIAPGSGLNVGLQSSSGRSFNVNISKDNLDFFGNLVGSAIQRQTEKKTIKILGQVQKITSAVLNSSSPKSTVQIKGQGKGARLPVDNVTATGPFSSIDLKDADIVQNINLSQGTAKKLIAGNVMDDHLIEIGPASPADGITAIDITLDRVANTDLISMTPIRTLTVTEWIDDDGDPDMIIAPWIGKIIVKGNSKEGIAGHFMAGLDLTGVGAPKGVTLGSVKVAGDISIGRWDVIGDAGAIAARSTLPGWIADFTGNVKSIATSLDMGGIVNAASVASITVKRDARELFLSLTNELDPDDDRALTLGKLSVTHLLENSFLHSAGHVGTVSVGAMVGSTLYAGVSLFIQDLPFSSADFFTFPTLKSFTVKGLPKEMPNSFVNSYVAAWEIGSATVVSPRTDNAGTPFGLAATFIGKVAVKDAVIGFSASNLEPLGTTVAPFEDFELRVF